ncbi:hypothetical protein KO481_39160 [Nocardia sp. NEAU-G5]|uniref:Secreted protein n=1 Tax=Nocardia albiluteola TaxID=2842303 RepID=A0ABS6BEE7_9NOCA|nr:hypothetical protein [Nocardia albiluteola]MBU3067529.1 hypothetical protein [Nocardia albiluteola]
MTERSEGTTGTAPTVAAERSGAATATQVRPDAPSARRGVLSTARDRLPERSDRPAWIRLLAVVAVIAAFATALTVALGASALRNGIDSLGHKTAPGVAASQDLASALADMDAQTTNLLLVGDDSALSDTRTYALTTYEQRRTQADRDLQQATAIAGNDAGAKDTVNNLLDQFGQYQALVANIELLESSGHNPAGHPSADILSQYQQATDMNAGMLRETQILTDQNSTVLQTAYASTRHSAAVSGMWLAIFALVLFVALIGLQIMLRLMMRRWLNPALLVATALALAMVIGGAIATAQAESQLRTAKQDAFDSLLSLEQARAIGYDANADESRYLADPARAQDYQNAFLSKSQRLVQLGMPTQTQYYALPQYYPALVTGVDAVDGGHGAAFGGLFGDELHNITFAGEGDAAKATVDAYRAYQADDHTLRADAATDLRQAISFDTNPQPGSSDGDFDAFNSQLDILIGINQHAFDTAIPAGIDALSGWATWLPYVLFALVTVAIFLGVRPRLAEYR